MDDDTLAPISVTAASVVADEDLDAIEKLGGVLSFTGTCPLCGKRGPILLHKVGFDPQAVGILCARHIFKCGPYPEDRWQASCLWCGAAGQLGETLGGAKAQWNEEA